MDDKQVWHALVQVIRETFDREDLEVSRQMTAREVEEWDSLSNVELMVAVESTFSVRLRTGEIAGLKSVGELADVIQHRLDSEAARHS